MKIFNTINFKKSGMRGGESFLLYIYILDVARFDIDYEIEYHIGMNV